MNMESLINKVITEEELLQQLKQLGIKEGMNIEVHSSLKSIGFVVGGAKSVVDALLESVGDEGTIMMACQDSNNSEPLYWENPPVELRLVQTIRDNMPGYDIRSSEIPFMGKIAENLRCRENTFHSYHPNCAFIANGRNARFLMSNQTLNFPLSESSPLGKLYQLDGYVLLIGVDYDNCTAMHLAEYRSKVRDILIQGGAVKSDGKSVWKKYLDIDLNSDEFVEIGRAMEQNHMVYIAKLGDAICRFFNVKEAVDFSTKYLQNKYSVKTES